MGAKSKSNVKYYNVTSGQLKRKVGEKEFEYYQGYEGLFVGLKLVEKTFNNKPNKQFQLTVKDPDSDEVAIIQWGAKSWFTPTFFQRFGGLNLTQPFYMGISGGGDESRTSFCWMKQGNKKIEKNPDFPLPVKEKDGDEVQYKYGEVLKAAEKLMEQANKSVSENKAVESHKDQKEDEGW